MKTKAAFLCEQNAPLKVGVVDVPDLTFGQVLVRLRASGVCGKQLDEQVGTRGHDPYLPHLLGHEGGGIVEAIGPGVTKVSAGDHVIAGWMKGSGINAPTPEYRTEEGDRINAGNITTFQELSIISENRLTPIPKDVPFDVAAVLGCAIPTGFGIVLNQAQVKPGSTVAIYGCGGIGLSVVMAAALVSPSKVIVIDAHEAKLKLAKELGATHVLNFRSAVDPVTAVRELTLGQGVDYSIAAVGNATAMEQAYQSARKDTGLVVLAGVPREKISIDAYQMNWGCRLVGSHGGETVVDEDLPRYVELFRQGKLEVEKLITDRFRLEQVNQSLEMLRNGDIAGRALLEL